MTEYTTATFDSIDRRQFLRAGVGVAGTTVALSAFTGTAAAHFPEKITIDIEPKSEKNRLELGSGGTVTVAVIQTDGFDPTSKPVHYRFGAPDVVKGGGGARPAGGGRLKDVNGDGKMDLILEFPLAETGFDGGENTGQLYWEIHKGGAHGYSGTAPVTLIGGGQPAATTAPTAQTANPVTMTTAATQKPMTMTTTGAAPTTGAASTATEAASTATNGESTAATDESTAATTTTTAQGPGFGLFTALGGVASIGAYLFARNSDNE